MIKLIDILNIDLEELKNFFIDESWLDFFKDEENKKHLIHILLLLKNQKYTPSTLDKVLIFLTKDLNNCKILIKGADAYPEEGRATGIAFEVDNLNSWSEPFNQNSLQNIVRLLYKDYNNLTIYKDIPKFKEIRKKIELYEFKILPPNKLFKHWNNQGVLLLNSYPTCDLSIKNKSNSHRELWEDFSNKLFTYISYKNPSIIWFLWGTESIKIKKLINKNITIIESRHPMMCSEKYENDFLKSNCFKDTMDLINWIN